MSKTAVVTGKVRASYVNLDQPRAQQEGQEPKYSITLLVPKSDTATLSALKAAQETAISAKWGDKRPKQLDSTIRDGDGHRPNGEDFGDECKGHYVFTVSSKIRPGVVDQNLKPIIHQGGIVSGDFIHADINCYAYDRAGKRGTSFGLNNVQLVSKGEPLGTQRSAASAFSVVAVEDEEPVSF